jgi:hypothetical protein
MTDTVIAFPDTGIIKPLNYSIDFFVPEGICFLDVMPCSLVEVNGLSRRMHYPLFRTEG